MATATGNPGSYPGSMAQMATVEDSNQLARMCCLELLRVLDFSFSEQMLAQIDSLKTERGLIKRGLNFKMNSDLAKLGCRCC
jgi:hypothetical protein